MPITYGNAIKFVSASSQAAARTRVSTAVDNYTIAFWLYIDSVGSTKVIFTNGSGAAHEGFRLYISSTGVLTCDIIFVAGCDAGTALTLSTWYHVVCVRDAGTSKFYINGAASGTTTAGAPNGLVANSTTGLGAYFDHDSAVGATPNYSDARMDDVRFYNRAISASEALALYNYGLNINNPDISNTSLVAWWKMDEASGNPVDNSGNGNTLTNLNASTFVTGKVQLTNTPDTGTTIFGDEQFVS